MPAYLIEVEKDIPAGRLIIRASNPTQAIRHFWRSRVQAQSLSGDELLKLILDDKVPVEDAKATPDENPPVLSPATPETYAHKLACPAPSHVPIGKANCKCTELDLY